MSLPFGTSASVAIRLRILVREAIARDDIAEVIRLNKIADAAYLALNASEALIYLDWCRDDIAKLIAVRGDA